MVSFRLMLLKSRLACHYILLGCYSQYALEKEFLWLVFLIWKILSSRRRHSFITRRGIRRHFANLTLPWHLLACHRQWIWVCKSSMPLPLPGQGTRRQVPMLEIRRFQVTGSNLTSPTCWLVRDLAQNRPHGLPPSSP